MARVVGKRSPWNVPLMDTDRRCKGWTYSDIAEEAGISLSAVSRFFSGTFQSPKAAKKIALALGHPVSRYVRGAGVAA